MLQYRGHNTTCSLSKKCYSGITWAWAYLSYTSISVIRGTPRATIALCTCTVSACSLHAFSSNWRTRNAEIFTTNHGYEQHSWSSRSRLPAHFSTNTLHWNSALKEEGRDPTLKVAGWHDNCFVWSSDYTSSNFKNQLTIQIYSMMRQ